LRWASAALRERQHGVDHGLEAPRREHAQERAELACSADAGAVDRLVLAVEVRPRERDVVAGRGGPPGPDPRRARPGEAEDGVGRRRSIAHVEDPRVAKILEHVGASAALLLRADHVLE
jgi:hypothetical protein